MIETTSTEANSLPFVCSRHPEIVLQAVLRVGVAHRFRRGCCARSRRSRADGSLIRSQWLCWRKPRLARWPS